MRALHQMMYKIFINILINFFFIRNFDPTISRMINFSPIKPCVNNKFLQISNDSFKSPKIQQSNEINDNLNLHSTPIIVEIESIPTSKCRDLVSLKKNEDGLQVSRSGRIIKPRLQKSGGERIAYDIYGNPIGAYCVTTHAPNKPNYSEKLVNLFLYFNIYTILILGINL